MQSPMGGFPAIGPGSGSANHITDAIPGPRSASYSRSTAPGTDFEDDDKGVYELDPDTAKLVEDMKRQDQHQHGDNKSESVAAANRKKGLLAALKGVPRVVGSMDHAIAPMAPVSSVWYLLSGFFQEYLYWR